MRFGCLSALRRFISPKNTSVLLYFHYLFIQFLIRRLFRFQSFADIDIINFRMSQADRAATFVFYYGFYGINAEQTAYISVDMRRRTAALNKAQSRLVSALFPFSSRIPRKNLPFCTRPRQLLSDYCVCPAFRFAEYRDRFYPYRKELRE